MDLGLAQVIGSALTVAGVVYVARLQRKTNHHVTQNHHSSQFPTIPDRLDNIEKALRDLPKSHKEWHKENE